MLLFVDQSNHGNNRGRINCSIPVLIVEAYISTHHRDIKKGTGICQSLYALFEHVVCFRLVRVPEIEIIGDRQSSCSRTSQVTHTFYKGDLSTFVRIKMAETIVTVIGDSQVLINSCNA